MDEAKLQREIRHQEMLLKRAKEEEKLLSAKDSEQSERRQRIEAEEAALDGKIHDAEVRLSEDEAKNMRLADEALEKCSKLPEEFKTCERVTNDIRKNIARLESLRISIHGAHSARHWQQVSCTEQSVFGNVLGIFGVLAAPISGGTSLALTVCSSATNIHGQFREIQSKEELEKRLSPMTQECNDIILNTQKLFSEIEPVIQRIEETLKRSADISRNVSVIPFNVSNGSNGSQSVYQVAGKVLIPLREVCKIISSLSVCITLVKTESCCVFARTTITVVNGLFESSVQVRSLRAISTSFNMAKQTWNCALKLSQDGATLQLMHNSVTVQRVSTCALFALGGSQIKSTHTVVCGYGVKRSASVTVKATKSISKLNLAMNVFSLCNDLYSLSNQNNQQRSEQEKELDNVIYEFKMSLAELDKFISGARKEYEGLQEYVKAHCPKK